MPVSKKIFLITHLSSLLLCYESVAYAHTTSNITYAKKTYDTSLPFNVSNEYPNNKTSFFASLLYIQPYSNNLQYATFVSGTQPYYQSWHYQSIQPSYHPAFELGFNYAITHTPYSAGINWLHLNSNDSSSKQASRNTDLTTVEFVGPPYEMSPPVFGIKHVDSKVNFDYNNVLLNGSKLVDFDSHIQARFFGGINVLKLNQTVTTTFSDYAGCPATPYSYPLPPDPSFSFQTENLSKYFGAGPDLGVSVHYKIKSGFGLMGDFLGMISAGTIQAQDNFTSTSARLTTLGIGTSHQQITTPNTTQVVLGADAKLGIFYNYQGTTIPDLTIELGYRLATYANAISTINPNTLVQPGTVVTTPEFSTGTMAIVSTDARTRPFSFNGPFLNIKIAIA
ncbi:MAG: Lpg1974 family pore-forming outer membrane protein [Gammaproteobacteria bacterium]|nr:Lpg1974 family pore-forming outer membrane protein [Gammaproteobacteria bacterium]